MKTINTIYKKDLWVDKKNKKQPKGMWTKDMNRQFTEET